MPTYQNVGRNTPKENPRRPAGKDTHIETLRGITILLVVFGHMIAGMNVGEESAYRYLHYSLSYIRMPLFTVISGWVYANKPVQPLQQSAFITGKVRRLLLPMFVVSTALFLCRVVVPGTNHPEALQTLPLNLIIPYDVYWFIYSLFVIFILMTVLDLRPFLHSFRGWLIALTASLVTLAAVNLFLDAVPNVASFKGAAYLLPFFLVGVGLYRFSHQLLNPAITRPLLVLFVVGMILQQLSWFGVIPSQHRSSLLGIAVGILSILLLFRLRFKSRPLMRIGGYAYSIFLFHVFFTGGIRILAGDLLGEPTTIVIGVAGAVLFSIALENLVIRSRLLRVTVLGLRP